MEIPQSHFTEFRIAREKRQRDKVRLRAMQGIRSKMEKEILYFVMKLNPREMEPAER